jgi:hypothetical protein
MPTRTIGIVVDGATGRLGTTQHLRALLAIAGEGGLALANGDRLVPLPVLLGRNPERLAALAGRSGGLHWTPTAMPASPIRRPKSISTPAPPAGGRSAPVPPLPPRSTSISKSRSRRI